MANCVFITPPPPRAMLCNTADLDPRPSGPIAVPDLGRRSLMSAFTGAAFAGAALIIAAPAADHTDAALFALCAEFERVQRHIKGHWSWRVGEGTIRSPSYIEDDDEREAAIKPLEEEAWQIHLRIYDHRATTIEGMRAKVRCLLLVDGEMRDLVKDDEDAKSSLGLYAVTRNLLITLLQDLSDGSITDATCADVGMTEVVGEG